MQIVFSPERYQILTKIKTSKAQSRSRAFHVQLFNLIIDRWVLAGEDIALRQIRCKWTHSLSLRRLLGKLTPAAQWDPVLAKSLCHFLCKLTSVCWNGWWRWSAMKSPILDVIIQAHDGWYRSSWSDEQIHNSREAANPHRSHWRDKYPHEKRTWLTPNRYSYQLSGPLLGNSYCRTLLLAAIVAVLNSSSPVSPMKHADWLNPARTELNFGAFIYRSTTHWHDVWLVLGGDKVEISETRERSMASFQEQTFVTVEKVFRAIRSILFLWQLDAVTFIRLTSPWGSFLRSLMVDTWGHSGSLLTVMVHVI